MLVPARCDLDRAGRRTYRLGRISELHRTGARVQPPRPAGGQDPATDLADAWTNAPGMLRARLLGSSDTATEPSFTRLPVGGIHVTRLRPRDTGATVTAPKRQAVMEPAELQAKGEGAAKR